MLTRLLFSTLAGCGMSAYASSVTNFTLSATLQAGTAQGTITIDTAAGQVTGGDFTVNAPAPPGLPPVTDTFITLGNTGFNGTNQIADFISGTDRFEVSFPVISLVNYAGSPLCSTTERNGCTIAGSAGYYPTLFVYFGGELADAAVSASLTSSATPEPSAGLLIGAGLIGVISWIGVRRVLTRVRP